MFGRVRLIYIPLCFYFIGYPHRYPKELRQYLHSTMLLLYRNQFLLDVLALPHLHSTMLLLYHSEEMARLIDGLIFTFHYASTLSLYRKEGECRFYNLHSTMLLLYQIWVFRRETPHLHLHSTMLLLYQGKEINKMKFENIYIPLCFYFIWEIRPGTGMRINLHSTMLLLYRFCGKHYKFCPD